MIVSILAGGALLWAVSNTEPSPGTTNPTLKVDNKDLLTAVRAGNTAPQEASWDAPPFRPYHYGARPFHRRYPVPSIKQPGSTILTEEGNRLTDEYKEHMRQAIEDTEWDDVPFRGERATYWAGRDRRRLPFINHPNSEQAWVFIPDLCSEVEDYPPRPQPSVDPKAVSLGRLTSKNSGVVAMAVTAS